MFYCGHVDAVGCNSLPIIGHPLLHLKSEIDEASTAQLQPAAASFFDINYLSSHMTDSTLNVNKPSDL